MSNVAHSSSIQMFAYLSTTDVANSHTIFLVAFFMCFIHLFYIFFFVFVSLSLIPLFSEKKQKEIQIQMERDCFSCKCELEKKREQNAPRIIPFCHHRLVFVI